MGTLSTLGFPDARAGNYPDDSLKKVKHIRRDNLSISGALLGYSVTIMRLR
jgi:hypothetical protein